MRKQPRIDRDSRVQESLKAERQNVHDRMSHDKKSRRKFVKKIRKMKRMKSRMRGEEMV